MSNPDDPDTDVPRPDAALQPVMRLVSHHHLRLPESEPGEFFYRAPAVHGP
jgi:hypothetical protein